MIIDRICIVYRYHTVVEKLRKNQLFRPPTCAVSRLSRSQNRRLNKYTIVILVGKNQIYVIKR